MSAVNRNRSLRLQTLAIATAMALGAPAAFAAQVNSHLLDGNTQYDRFIVKYKAGTPEAASVKSVQRSLDVANERFNVLMSKQDSSAKSSKLLNRINTSHIRRMALGADVIAASSRLNKVGAEAFMRQVAANPNVEYIEPDRILKAVLTPNDTSYSSQWGFQDADAGIRANTAWDVATGTGVTVAVLDTGITSHTDLNANVVAGYDFISNSTTANDGGGRDSNPADPGDWTTGQCGPASNSSWHGTHVAGTVAAITNNSAGVAGTAFNAKVMPVRVLGTCGGSTSDIADAIIWASGGTVSGVTTLSAANAAKVINMSLGGSGSCDTTTQNAINSAVGRGTTVVVAAGNSNANAANFTPASCANVVNVASVTSSSARSSFSNFGASIDVSAPGSTILSTLNSGTTTPGSQSYANYSGTSMAAPHVAGTVALMQSRRIALGLALLTPAQVESTLKSTAYALAGSCSGGCGAGIINARAAVDSAGGGGGGGGSTERINVNLPSASTGNVTSNYTVTIPSGTTKLTVTIAGGTGDADLYVRAGSAPTTSSYSCRPYLSGNNETCTFNNPTAGTVYYINVRAYSSYSGVNLKAVTNP
jgi:serine protease